MTTIRPRGRYGIDAPWVPWMWVGYAVLYAAMAVMAATLWNAWWWVPPLLALIAVASAAGAALFWHTSLRGKFLLWDRLLTRITLPNGSAALDLGCGHGTVSIMTALRFPHSTVTGIDLWRSIDQSGNTITAAESNAARNGVEERIRFDTGDMTELPYPDDAFDLVTASVSIHNIPSSEGRRQALREAVRVLAPGGHILIADIRRTREYAADLEAAGLHMSRLSPWAGRDGGAVPGCPQPPSSRRRHHLYDERMSDHLPHRSRLVHDALRAAGIPGEIVVLPDSAATAALAAAALGIEVGAIANSLVFWSDGEPILVMTSGAHRVDTAALAARIGRSSIVRATPEQVREATGQGIGGVAPTGHPAPLTTFVDEALADHPEIWAAGGTPHTVFPLTFDQLVALTDGRVVRVD